MVQVKMEETAEIRTARKNRVFDRLLSGGAGIQAFVVLMGLSGLYICLCGAYPVRASTIVRNWSLAGEREEAFTMADSCSFTVSFPDLVPPTHLFGYDRFTVAISDSLDGSAMNVRPVLRFSFDAGFLFFDHMLTVTIPVTSPLISDSLRQSGTYRLYRDPFPYTGFHQWYADDSITVDTVRSLIRFVYHHRKYIPLQKSRVNAAVKIASTGYPFIFGLFVHSSIGIGHRRRGSQPVAAGFVCRMTDKGIVAACRGYDGTPKNTSYRVALFDTRGGRVGQWRPPAFPALLPLSSRAPAGMYRAVLYHGGRRIASCLVIAPGCGVIP